MSKSKKVIVDTGFIVALFSENDAYHELALKVEQSLGDETQFVSTLFVIQEIYNLISSRTGVQNALRFMEEVVRGLISLPKLPDDFFEKQTIVLKRYQDRKLDFADASLIVLADHLNLGEIVSVDFTDFSIVKWANGKKSFANLMKSSS